MKCYRTKLSLENRLPSNDMKSIIIFSTKKISRCLFLFLFFCMFVLTVFFCYKNSPEDLPIMANIWCDGPERTYVIRKGLGYRDASVSISFGFIQFGQFFFMTKKLYYENIL